MRKGFFFLVKIFNIVREAISYIACKANYWDLWWDLDCGQKEAFSTQRPFVRILILLMGRQEGFRGKGIWIIILVAEWPTKWHMTGVLSYDTAKDMICKYDTAHDDVICENAAAFDKQPGIWQDMTRVRCRCGKPYKLHGWKMKMQYIIHQLIPAQIWYEVRMIQYQVLQHQTIWVCASNMIIAAKMKPMFWRIWYDRSMILCQQYHHCRNYLVTSLQPN